MTVVVDLQDCEATLINTCVSEGRVIHSLSTTEADSLRNMRLRPCECLGTFDANSAKMG